MSMVGA